MQSRIGDAAPQQLSGHMAAYTLRPRKHRLKRKLGAPLTLYFYPQALFQIAWATLLMEPIRKISGLVNTDYYAGYRSSEEIGINNLAIVTADFSILSWYVILKSSRTWFEGTQA